MLFVKLRHELIYHDFIIFREKWCNLLSSLIWVWISFRILIDPCEKLASSFSEALNFLRTTDRRELEFASCWVDRPIFHFHKLCLFKFFIELIALTRFECIMPHGCAVKSNLKPWNYMVHIFYTIRSSLENNIVKIKGNLIELKLVFPYLSIVRFPCLRILIQTFVQRSETLLVFYLIHSLHRQVLLD